MQELCSQEHRNVLEAVGAIAVGANCSTARLPVEQLQPLGSTAAQCAQDNFKSLQLVGPSDCMCLIALLRSCHPARLPGVGKGCWW